MQELLDQSLGGTDVVSLCEEQRLLTKRSWQTLHWKKTLVECETAENFKKLVIQTVTSLFSRKQTCLTTVHAAHVPGDFCVPMTRRRALRCKNAESRDVLREQLKRRPGGNTSNMHKQ